ncbi:MAG: tRNA lysidine(34) synthetase TilS [Candidatus Latescibacterota bacterium]|nr:tRNA lysidine(34) synthetase TilS [Candidatus Latescibacterota bacterium]MEE2727658.1 tRNA lysidine(34) synthetase TilS [Candidatus Latescibacterota bacterium]
MSKREDTVLSAIAIALCEAGCTRSERMLVGVSGGIDSMVLMDIMSQLVDSCVVVHCDHRLRDQSAEDARFVAMEAERRGCVFIAGSDDVAARAREGRMSIEEAGREARYALFAQVASEVGAMKVVLGHHMDDQAETVLMRLMRGSGSTGLRGMVPLREGVFLRPMLNVTRAQIKVYAEENDIAFREDETNADRRFLRNRVRGDLLPTLRQYNPNIVQTLHRVATVLQGEDSFVEEAAQNAINSVLIECCEHKVMLDVPRLVDYHIAVQRRLIRLALGRLFSGHIEYAWVDKTLRLAKGKKSALCDLGKGIRAQCWDDRLILRQGRECPIAVRVPMPGSVRIPERDGVISCRITSAEAFEGLRSELGGFYIALDADKLEARPLLRSAAVGDRFRPFGMRGQKKLSDFLIDQKHPRILRDEVLVLESAGEIAWVVGMRMSDAFRVEPSSRRIAFIQFSITA